MQSDKIEAIPVRISASALVRRIGGKRNKELSPRLKAATDRAVREVRSHARPRALYRIMPTATSGRVVRLGRDIAFRSGRLAHTFRLCNRAAVFLTTLGDGVDRLIRRSMEEKPGYAFLLDAAASVAADSAAEYVEEYLNDERLAPEEGTTMRYSPGYCDWPLQDQGSLFSALPHHEIGVKLSDTSLMSPRKSVSGVIGICAAEALRDGGCACLTCPKTSCQHRREPART